MNTKLVNSAAGVINAALTQNRTAAGIALALESAQMLMTPEAAAELASYQALDLGTPEGRVSAKCDDAKHPVWLRELNDVRGCPWCRVAELEGELRLRNTQRGDVEQLIERERGYEECVDIADLEAALGLGSDEPVEAGGAS